MLRLCRPVVPRYCHAMRFSAVIALCVALLLPGCGTADDSPRAHPADGPDDAELRLELAQAIRAHMQTTGPQIGVPPLDPALFSALAQVPRHAFLPPPLRPFAYLDVPLPVHKEQNTAQPYLVALMTQLAAIEPANSVFETGTGAGYHAAILSLLARKVYSVEVIEPLAKQAAETLRRLGYEGVEVRAGDGYYGWPEKAPFDAIIIKEAVSEVPAPLLNQLKRGGRLVAPVGPLGQSQMLRVVTKDADGHLRHRDVLPVHFSPLQGGQRI